MIKREENERKFQNWEKYGKDGRKYWYEVFGKRGWKARYIKIVDSNEKTLSFYQEIFDEEDKLVEIHQKFPIDEGHKKIK